MKYYFIIFIALLISLACNRDKNDTQKILISYPNITFLSQDTTVFKSLEEDSAFIYFTQLEPFLKHIREQELLSNPKSYENVEIEVATDYKDFHILEKYRHNNSFEYAYFHIKHIDIYFNMEKFKNITKEEYSYGFSGVTEINAMTGEETVITEPLIDYTTQKMFFIKRNPNSSTTLIYGNQINKTNITN